MFLVMDLISLVEKEKGIWDPGGYRYKRDESGLHKYSIVFAWQTVYFLQKQVYSEIGRDCK